MTYQVMLPDYHCCCTAYSQEEEFSAFFYTLVSRDTQQPTNLLLMTVPAAYLRLFAGGVRPFLLHAGQP
jgi:hypothetical protein